MSELKTTRRELAAITMGGALAAGVLGASISPASAYQGNMERAVRQLNDALASLQAATPNKGGHRERAMDLVRRAIAQVEEGIVWAAQHGGGG